MGINRFPFMGGPDLVRILYNVHLGQSGLWISLAGCLPPLRNCRIRASDSTGLSMTECSRTHVRSTFELYFLHFALL